MAVCERDDVSANRIPVDYASHSAHVEELRETLRESLSGLRPRAGDIAFISAVTGAGLDTSILDGDTGSPICGNRCCFEQAVRWSYEHGYRTFIESSPHPVLTVGIAGITRGLSATTTAWLGRFDATKVACAGSCCRLPKPTYTGNRPTGRACSTTPARVAVDLPTYAFQRKRYWMDPAHGSSTRAVSASHAAEHPLLGAIVAHADSDEIIFTGRLSLASHPWLADHKVHGVVLVPGAAMVEHGAARG